MKSKLIRYCLVVGNIIYMILAYQNSYTQVYENLMLDKAKKMIKINEAVHEQQEFLQGDTKGKPISLDGVRTNHVSLPRNSWLVLEYQASLESIAKSLKSWEQYCEPMSL